ncbi:S8 family serine peptidase [Clostridium brassicae]|uniref:S8 family serine peptidase n=1 Tax=Clostridium brassicae TaxID=2999072 RepID=A0ABT4DA09_9CLOT|nr:S8 family serine peptidase [Clostridium brassicae]MCY6958488.1 S8 family serine peptidase [Clostridium brassicae]
MESKIRIAIIDNGIDSVLLKDNIENNIYVNNTGITISEKNNINKQQFQHGTICALIIRKYCPMCDLTSIRLLDCKGKGRVSNLEAALQWCQDNNIKIVNLSFGTTHFADKRKIQKIINYFANRDMILISATSNDGYVTYPASFSKVIGVDSGNSFEFNRKMLLKKGIEIECLSEHEIVLNNCNILTPRSSSYAAPYVTAKIGNIFLLQEILNKKLLLKELDKENFNINSSYELIFEPDWISKAWIADFQNKSASKYYFDVITGDYEKIKEKIDTIIVKSKIALNGLDLKGKNIVYLGEKNLSTSNIDGYVWTKKNRIEQIEEIGKNRYVIDIPLILFKIHNEIDEYEWLNKLNINFGKDNYNAYVASFHEESILYGLEYIPREVLVKGANEILYNFLGSQIYYLKSDVIVISIGNEFYTDESFIQWDMLINIEKYKGKVNVCIVCGEYEEYNLQYDSIDSTIIYDVYRNIIKGFSEGKNV